MLRVLEIQLDDKSLKMPREIGNLIHLKYLCLKAGYRFKLPNTIGNLRNLRTLDLRHCGGIFLPSEISKLVGLRHLLLPTFFRKAGLFCQRKYFEVSRLRKILTLKYIPAELLRNDALLKLTNLQNLGIRTYTEDGFPCLEQLSSCHSLSKLSLIGEVGKEVASNGRHFLQLLPANLNKLVLVNTCLERDPMPVLEKLSNLRFLRMRFTCYVGDKLVCSAYGFPKLETLQFVSLQNLKEWHVEEGALQSLKRLDIQYLLSMEMIPDGLRFVTCLRELNIKHMAKSFCERLQVKDGIEGADFYKVAHIPSISFSDIYDQ